MQADMISTEYPYGPDFPIVCVETALCTARVSLYGAQLLNWAPTGQRDVFFVSPEIIFEQGKALRGGVPLCWPWFGKHPEDSSKPSHGVARTALWQLASSEVEESGIARLVLSLPPIDEMTPSGAVILELGEELLMSLITLDVPHQMPFSTAQHSYFAVSDYEQVAITGLEECPYIEFAAEPVEHLEDPLMPAGNIDRIYHPVAAETEICIHDPAWGRSIRILRDGSESSIVWNPGAAGAAGMADLGEENYRGFIAVESSVVPAENVSLRYGETHRLTTRVQLISID